MIFISLELTSDQYILLATAIRKINLNLADNGGYNKYKIAIYSAEQGIEVIKILSSLHYL